MRIVSWNVNSIKARLPRLVSWLEQRQPDVLLLQETKATAATFPAAELAARGYQCAELSSGRWNGVAIASRVGLDDVTRGLADQPVWEGESEARAIGATCAGIRLWSLYVPNGRTVGSEHYAYKLDFLAAVRAQAAAEQAPPDHTTRPFALLGDLNIAPRDADVWDPTAFVGATHVSAPERAALGQVLATGLCDLPPRASAAADDVRPPYTFWEMRMLGFQKGRGMRIDLVLANAALQTQVTDVWVDRDARKGNGPSDHAPLVLDLQ